MWSAADAKSILNQPEHAHAALSNGTTDPSRRSVTVILALGFALLQEARRFDRRLAHVAIRAGHAVDLDLEKCA